MLKKKSDESIQPQKSIRTNAESILASMEIESVADKSSVAQESYCGSNARSVGLGKLKRIERKKTRLIRKSSIPNEKKDEQSKQMKQDLDQMKQFNKYMESDGSFDMLKAHIQQ